MYIQSLSPDGKGRTDGAILHAVLQDSPQIKGDGLQNQIISGVPRGPDITGKTFYFNGTRRTVQHQVRLHRIRTTGEFTMQIKASRDIDIIGHRPLREQTEQSRTAARQLTQVKVRLKMLSIHRVDQPPRHVEADVPDTAKLQRLYVD